MISFSPLRSAEIFVSNASELNAALSSAHAGTTIVMKNGIWKDVQIEMKCPGSAGVPVVLKAERSGAVILTGSSQLIFSADWQRAEGLSFKNGGRIDSGKYFAVVRFNAANCRLTQTAIIDYNPADPKTPYYYVFFAGNSNRMDHCLLTGKGNNEPVVGNSDENSRYNTVDHCLIRDIPYVANNNGREIFRIWGYGHHEVRHGDVRGNFFTIEKNLFEHADGEGTEIISIKSDSNIVRKNIIRASRGELSLRGGNCSLVEGNVIIGEKGRGCLGIRVAGRGHRIIGNVVRDCESGIRFMSGEYIEKDLTGFYEPKPAEGSPLGRMPWYGWVQNCVVANNSLLNNQGPDILMGFHYKDKWPSIQLILLPENNSVRDNFILKDPGLEILEQTSQDMTPPFNVVTIRRNNYEGNVCVGGVLTSTTARSGFIMHTPKKKGNAACSLPRSYGLTQNANENILQGEEVGTSWKVSAKRSDYRTEHSKKNKSPL